jgi:hypothetical protein
VVIADTFTLAPFAIAQLQPQEKGVSPGHSGVDVEIGTEISMIMRDGRRANRTERAKEERLFERHEQSFFFRPWTVR